MELHALNGLSLPLTVDQRVTYRYRRIAALLNRERRVADMPVVNVKRVHRIMGNHAMLLSSISGTDRLIQRLFAQALNLTPASLLSRALSRMVCPRRSSKPEGGYIRILALPEAETALRLMDEWMEDRERPGPQPEHSSSLWFEAFALGQQVAEFREHRSEEWDQRFQCSPHLVQSGNLVY